MSTSQFLGFDAFEWSLVFGGIATVGLLALVI